MEISFLDEFHKEFKKLLKKYNSLQEDLNVFLKALKIDPTGKEIPGIVEISGLGKDIKQKVFKVKKFRCKSISKNSKNSGIRIIYSYEENTGKIEFQKIEFIEIYHKNQKANHDIERIRKRYG